jgi:hypothetical protein
VARSQYAHVIAEHYGEEYERVFGPLSALDGIPSVAGPIEDSAAAKAWSSLDDAQRDAVTRVFVDIGKAIAAYERRGERASRRVQLSKPLERCAFRLSQARVHRHGRGARGRFQGAVAAQRSRARSVHA